MNFDVFTQLSLVLVIAMAISLVLRLLRQPMIIGYILTGIVVGPSVLHLIQQKDAFDTFSEIGIALLLFIVGLELSMAVIRRMGKPVFITAATLLLTLGTVGFVVSHFMGFDRNESILMGLAIFFSSTIIIVKSLSDKKELTRLNGQLAVGVIILDDIIATIALLFVASQGNGHSMDLVDIGWLAGKGILAGLALLILGAKVLPWLTKKMAESQELLFIFALAWGFGVATIVSWLGFSIEIGALFAGVSLAHVPYVHQIGARLKPLRDFFIILFFISLGDSLRFNDFNAVIIPALIFSGIVMLIKPFIVMLTLGLLGYTKHTSFKTAINLSQISEFSIILVVLAANTGVVRSDFAAIITIVAMVTIALSTYFMKYDDWMFLRLEKYLRFYQPRTIKESPTQKTNSYPLVLFGYQNGGAEFIRTFRKMKLPFIVVDYDPDVIDDLERRHINYLYGDATDPELLNEIDIEAASLVVNTIGDRAINIGMLRTVRKINDHAVVILYASDHNEAAELYDLGATYVFLPHFIGSEQLSSFLHEYGLNKKNFEVVRERHLEEIKLHLAAKDL